MKEWYAAIVATIALITDNDKPVFKWVKLFNDQFNKSNNDAGNNIEPAFNYPCLFVEFQDWKYVPAGFGLERLDNGIIRLHIGFESYKYEDIVMLELKQRVYQAIHLLQIPQYSALQRILDTQDTNHTNAQVFLQEYTLSGIDRDAWTRRTDVPAYPVDPLIDPDIVTEVDLGDSFSNVDYNKSYR